LEFDWADVRDGSHSIHDRGSGPFAMPIGSSVVSVFGGPADGVHFGERLHFTPQFLKPKAATPEQQARHEMYRRVRELRNSLGAVTTKHQRLSELIQAHSTSFADQWLIGVELHELARRWRFADLTEALERHLDALSMASPRNALRIDDGRRLADTP
jgi:phenylalanine-4-hydroxylase